MLMCWIYSDFIGQQVWEYNSSQQGHTQRREFLDKFGFAELKWDVIKTIGWFMWIINLYYGLSFYDLFYFFDVLSCLTPLRNMLGIIATAVLRQIECTVWRWVRNVSLYPITQLKHLVSTSSLSSLPHESHKVLMTHIKLLVHVAACLNKLTSYY